MSQEIIGRTIPNVSLSATDNKSIKLTDYAGQYLLLYFYPKDNTSGCSQEAIAFRDNMPQFSALDTVILGVSRDTVRSHEGFKGKQALPFDLLADTDEVLCQWFDVIRMKNMYGKQVRGIERSTFLIAPSGIVLHEWRKVRVKNHVDEVLQVLQAYIKAG